MPEEGVASHEVRVRIRIGILQIPPDKGWSIGFPYPGIPISTVELMIGGAPADGRSPDLAPLARDGRDGYDLDCDPSARPLPPAYGKAGEDGEDQEHDAYREAKSTRLVAHSARTVRVDQLRP